MSFRPYPVLTVFALICVAILIWLGNWQYGRFSAKMALDETEPNWEVLDGSVVPGSEVIVYAYVDGEAVWRRVVAVDTGTDIVFTTVELFYQVDPPVPCQGVDCGAGFRFSAKGFYKTVGNQNVFSGKDQPAEGIFYSFRPSRLAGILPQDTAARVSKQVFEPQTLQQVKNGRVTVDRNPFARLRLDDSLPAQRHFGYAITWWGLAMALLGVYLAFHHQKGRLRFRRGG